MSRLFVSLVFCLFSSSLLNAQNCFPNGIVFNSQADVDFFGANYSNCTVIGGDVEIDGNSIQNLNGLINIQSIQGNLLVDDCALGNFQGLNNLTNIQGDFTMYYQSQSISFQGLNNLNSIQGDVEISDCSIISMGGLNGLTSVGGDFRLADNDNLSSLAGLFNLSSVGGSLEISRNNALTALYGLAGLQTIGSTLYITDNLSLTNLLALSNVASALNGLFIMRNDNLTSLNGLANIASSSGQLRINSNDILTDISALNNVDFSNVSYLSIQDNPVLDVCDYTSICIALGAANSVNIQNNSTNCSSQLQLAAQCASNGLCVFTANNGAWNVASNWLGNMVPTQACDVYILNDRVCNVTPGTVGACNTICVEDGSELNFDSTSEITVFGN